MTKLLKGFLSRSRISNNTAPKLASLLFAVLLWIYVMDIEDPETMRTFKDVPVRLIHTEELTDSGLVLIDNQNFTVDVKIEGRRSDVLSAKKNEIELSADLIGFGKGANSIPIDTNVSADNVKIADLSKTEIKVELDRIVRIPKPVEVNIIGDLPDGYESGSVITNPQEILVEGPESYVNTVVKLVGIIEIEGHTSDLLKQIPIKAVDSENVVVSKVQPKVEYVDIQLSVDKTKSVDLRESVTGTVQEGYKLVGITLKPQSVMIRGDETVIDTVEWLSIQTIDISQITSESIQVVDLIVPEGIELPYLSVPVTATVDVEQIISKTFTFDLNDIKISNLSPKYDVSLLPKDSQFEINITGTESEISSLTKDNVHLALDLANHIKGKYSKSLKITLDTEYISLETPVKDVNIEIMDAAVTIPDPIPEAPKEGTADKTKTSQ